MLTPVTHAFTARPRTLYLPPTRATRATKARNFAREAKCFIVKTVRRFVLATSAFAFVAIGGTDGPLRALANVTEPYSMFQEGPVAQARAFALSQPPALIWTIDADDDGVADFSNPTHGGVRGIDAFGSGDFGAGRDAGKRRHEGVDYVAEVGAAVRAPISGEVVRLGYAYRGAGGLRSVDIFNAETKVTARLLYVAPSVEIGDVVVAGEEIGVAQDLSARYPGITNHVHVELRNEQRQLIDATEQLPSTSMLEVRWVDAPPHEM